MADKLADYGAAMHEISGKQFNGTENELPPSLEEDLDSEKTVLLPD
ncbi:MAG: hypothetical protein ACLQO6_06365 [Desulfomonilaceae bacterium]